MNRALVTGCAGFIGSHLTRRLLEAGWTVRGVDTLDPLAVANYGREDKRANLVAATGGFEALRVPFEFREWDAAKTIEQALTGCDVCFHLAARPGVRPSWMEFEDYVRANVITSKLVFEGCANAGVRCVYASSSSVYGSSPLPVPEEHPLRPISPYGASKAMVEHLANAYFEAQGLDAVGLRYFTVYGPRQRPDMAFARFIDAVTNMRLIHVYGNGLQRRDFTYVDDAVTATIAAHEAGRSGRVYNVCSGRSHTLSKVLTVLGDILDKELAYVCDEAIAGDVDATSGDYIRARHDLGYQPTVSLEEGLKLQVEAQTTDGRRG